MADQQPSPAPPRDEPPGVPPEGAPGQDTATPEPAAPEQAAVAELEDRWRRALADLDNLRKRQARELDRERAVERRRVAAAFLPVLDNLELALAHAGSDPSSIVDGVRRVLDQGVAVLAGLGFERRDDVGERFDPARHEVVRVVDEPGAEPGTVTEVLRAGYGDGASQLRPAAVAVSKGKG
jgi:molecular chaperone GrpE